MPIFFHRVIRIRNCYTQGISEDRCAFFKGDLVFLEVSCGLIWIPFKLDAHSVTATSLILYLLLKLDLVYTNKPKEANTIQCLQR